MHEDKLTHDERLRLECLAQAVNLYATDPRKPYSELLVGYAKQFEQYVSGMVAE